MIDEQSIDEFFFGLALDYKVQSDHLRAAPDHVLFPEFGQRILFKPVRKLVCVETMECGRSSRPVNHDDVLGLEMINQRHGLCANENLTVSRSRLKCAGKHADCEWMKSQFRLIDDEHVREFMFRLQ
jgi:hypothetical protein